MPATLGSFTHPSEPRIPARPTIYRGIQMRSRLEARCAAFLDRVRLIWEYEPVAFANERGQYLPDFYLPPVGLRVRPIYIEVKPTLEAAYAAMPRVAVILDSEPTAHLYLWVDEGVAFQRDLADPVWHATRFSWSV